MCHNQNCDLCSWKCFREEPHSCESRAMIQAGFEVVSVDHEEDTSFASVLSLDLSTKSGQRIFMEILSSKRLVAVHFGLPCGTASKARDRPISQELQRQRVPSITSPAAFC